MSGALPLAELAGWLPLLAILAAKATLVLLLTAMIAALLWRGSAAVRHLVWCVGLAGVLALPVLTALVPAWELPLLPSRAVPSAEVWDAPAGGPAGAEAPARKTVTTGNGVRGGDGDGSTTVGARLSALVAAVALAGVPAGLLWLAAGFWGVARLGRRAEVVRAPEWLRLAQDAAEGLGLRRPVLLLRSRGALMPATWGLVWPSVILPSTADGWSDERRRAVLAHELAHVKRFDCLTQALAQVACALFWWHPAVWYAARRLRVERERACDDLVLGAGARASDYAAHLLEIARTHRGPRLAALALVSMARPSQLESRLLWVLDEARSRRAPSAAATVLSVLAGALVVAPLSALRATETRPPVVPGPPRVEAEARVAAEPPSPPVAAQPPSPPAAVEPSSPPATLRPPSPPSAPSARGAVRGVEPPDTIPGRALHELLDMRSVGVDAAYIRALAAAGYTGLNARQLVELKSVGVTGRYADELNAAGYGRLTPAQLAAAGEVRLTSAYLADLRRHGYATISLRQATQLKEVGVTGRYIQELADVGLHALPPATLAELRAVGVNAAYIRELAAEGFGPVTAEQLVRLRGGDAKTKESRGRAPDPR